jgi:hypothetical protein
MRYVIVGGGPTGLSLAYILATNGYEVDLLERDNQLGGSWNAEWQEGKYWSENAPRVILSPSEFLNFIYDVGMKTDEFKNIYGNIITTNLKFASFFANHFTLTDYPIFIAGVAKYKTIGSETTLQDWLDSSSLSDGAKHAITLMCTTINAQPKYTHINDFFGSIGIASAKQMRDPNRWHTLLTEKFSIMPNIKIHLNTEAINMSMKEEQNQLKWIIGKHRETGKVSVFKGDRFVLAIEPNVFPKLLKSVAPQIKNNWNSWDWLQEWSERSYYIGFGFQLHFRERRIKAPSAWCWHCHSEWNIIILKNSEWLHQSSRDPLVNTVWSCCITNMDTKSKRLGLTANQCSKEQIMEECLHQLNGEYPDLPKPYKTTISSGLYRINNKWVSNNTGFSRMPNLGYLPITGNIPNLHAIGPYTDTGYRFVTNIDMCLRGVLKFIEEYEPDCKTFHNKYHNHRIIIMGILVAAMAFYLSKNKGKPR